MKTLFFDTETTGLYNFKLPPDHPEQPHLVQIACVFFDNTQVERASISFIIKPDGFEIPKEATKIHGITTEMALDVGVNLKTACFVFNNLCYQSQRIVAHNMNFDKLIMEAQFRKIQGRSAFGKLDRYCTMVKSTNYLKILKASPRHEEDWKWPKLEEAYRFFYKEDFTGAHDAMADVRACIDVYNAIQKLEQDVEYV